MHRAMVWFVPWIVCMMLLFIGARWVGATRRQSATVVHAIQGSTALHLEPFRYAIQATHGADVSLIFSESPANYPILSAMLTVPAWRKLKVAER